MPKEFTKKQGKGVTVFTLESDGGVTGVAAVGGATVVKPLGAVVKRNPKEETIKVPVKQKPRQGPLRPQTGGGAHRDKKKEQKQGKEKHRKPYYESEVEEMYGRRRDAYQRDYDSSIAGMSGSRDDKFGYDDFGYSLRPGHDEGEPVYNPRYDRARQFSQPSTLYFYKVKPGEEQDARAVGLNQSKKGSWYSKGSRNDAADKRFGPGREVHMKEGLRDPKDNPCWKGYHPVGTKKKNGRTVPNCVPNEGAAAEESYQGKGNHKGDGDVEEAKYQKVSAQQKFKNSMKRAGYDMDAGAKRLQDLLDKQKKEREEKEKKDMAEGDSGAKYKVKSIGKDSKGDYYMSPSTGKKVYKSGVNKGDHENPKTGEIKKTVAEDFSYQTDSMVSHISQIIRGIYPQGGDKNTYMKLVAREMPRIVQSNPKLFRRAFGIAYDRFFHIDQDDDNDNDYTDYSMRQGEKGMAEGGIPNLRKVMVPTVGQRVIADVSDYGSFGLSGTETGVIVRISSPRLIKVRIDKDGEIYDFTNNELYQQGVAEGLTPSIIHKLADRKGIKWDNEPSFLKLTKRLTGKEHLDDLDQTELQKVKQNLEKQDVAEGNPEYDDEAGMADNNLETLKRAVVGLDELIQPGTNLPEWCQEKIAVAKSMLVAVWDYMQSEEHSEHSILRYKEKMSKENPAEAAPKGWEGTVKAMKKHKEIDNPWALAHYMKNKGYKSHKKEDAYIESLLARLEEQTKK